MSKIASSYARLRVEPHLIDLFLWSALSQTCCYWTQWQGNAICTSVHTKIFCQGKWRFKDGWDGTFPQVGWNTSFLLIFIIILLKYSWYILLASSWVRCSLPEREEYPGQLKWFPLMLLNSSPVRSKYTYVGDKPIHTGTVLGTLTGRSLPPKTLHVLDSPSSPGNMYRAHRQPILHSCLSTDHKGPCHQCGVTRRGSPPQTRTH